MDTASPCCGFPHCIEPDYPLLAHAADPLDAERTKGEGDGREQDQEDAQEQDESGKLIATDDGVETAKLQSYSTSSFHQLWYPSKFAM